MKNMEVLNSIVTEEDVDHDSSSDASSCSVPIVRLNSENHDTESTKLLVEGTFVDMILTTLPILTEEEQDVIAAMPAHPAGLYALYASCLAGNLVEQLWNFAWPAAIALLHPSLLPVAVMGFCTKVAVIAGGPLVGKLMDQFPRVPAYNFLTTVQNFDDVLVPADHVSRSYNDTYYIDADTVLRCHTSAHQAELLRKGYTNFLVTGDVYRRDSIDSTHYPVFHQMEGVRVFSPNDWNIDGTSYAANDLKACLEGLARHLFGAVEMRWVDTYFPFTNPSFELEIYFQEKWLEVLGCGVMEQQILKRGGKTDNVAWAFGLGLERLAMVLFDIPDIRLFWSTDKRFTSQFTKGQLGIKFKPFSKYPPCYKDMSFWITDSFTENNLCEIVRGVAGDLAEEVQLIDNFTNKKGKTSHCYRITYRSMERSLTDEEINELQWNVRDQVQSQMNVELR